MFLHTSADPTLIEVFKITELFSVSKGQLFWEVERTWGWKEVWNLSLEWSTDKKTSWKQNLKINVWRVGALQHFKNATKVFFLQEHLL